MTPLIGPVRVRPAKCGQFEISEFSVSEDEARNFNRITMFHAGSRYIHPGVYTKLSGCGRSVIMSNTQAEIDDHREIVRAAAGDVFIAGLGIGMVLDAILRKGDEIRSVTVLEKEKDIIDMVAPWYKGEPKVTILHGDAFNPGDVLPKGLKFNTLYFDIWDTICSDNYPEMKALTRKYSRRKLPSSSTLFWCLRQCRRMYMRDQKTLRRYNQGIGWY